MTDPVYVGGVQTFSGARTITVPASVHVGDIGFVILGADTSTPSPATNPSGWTVLLNSHAAGNSNWRILYRVRAAGDPAEIVFGGSPAGTATAFWYRNAKLGNVGAPWVRSSTVATVTCPSVARQNRGRSTIVAFAGDRSIAANSGELGHASVAGATYRARWEGDTGANAGANICAVFLADIGCDAPAAAVTWTLHDSSGNAIGLQWELISTWPTVEVFNGSAVVKAQTVSRWDGAAEHWAVSMARS